MKKFLEFIFKNVANKELDSKIAESIIREYQAEMNDRPASENSIKDIAVIGMSCNFGKAENIQEFWHNIEQGIDCLEEVPEYRWDKEKRYSADRKALRSYSKWGSFASRANKFDSDFFNQSEISSMVTDPQQRLFLHLCWEALENAGYGSRDSRMGKDIGVFVGVRGNVYNTETFVSNKNMSDMSRKDSIEFIRSVLLGKAPNMVAAAVSNYLDLKGPSMAVDTACSSSLVSIHLACQSIINGDCDMSIAGGIEVIVDPNTYVYLSQINALSPEGKCKTFDKNANGYVPGEGGGAVILKSLDKAIKDKDNIVAVIKATAVNNDGYTVGVTTPDIEGQKRVIKKAYRKAGVKPDSVTLIEAHGTGTFLGDPTEFRALTEVFRENTEKCNFCALGTVKSNIGHLHSAAGIASFIKIALALNKGRIPATLNCNEPNPRFNLISSPFYISDKTTNWVVDKIKRRAGISSFGFGGTNCHIVLEEHPAEYTKKEAETLENHLAVYSAKDNEALKRVIYNHLEYLNSNVVEPGDYSYTLNTGRELFEKRICVSFKNIEELRGKLSALINDKEKHSLLENVALKNSETPKTAMVFPGQGSQYYGMAKELYIRIESFREAFNKCDAVISKYLGQSVKEIIYSSDVTNDLINQTAITQPIVFAIDYSIGKMWLDLGIKPDAVLGHSIGEYAAACIAGVFTLEEAARIIVKRAALMNSIDCNGGMMVVFADEATVRKVSGDTLPELEAGISIAAINGPANIVISGTNKDLEIVKSKLSKLSLNTRELAVSHPFHSKLMAPILEEFRNEFNSIKMKRAQIPLVSNLTGDFKYNFDVDYWLEHIIEPVRFNQSINFLTENKYDIFIEAGPGTTAATMLKRIEQCSQKVIIPTINRYDSDWDSLTGAVSTVIKEGLDINFNILYSKRNKIELPTYPFNYRDYWINQEKSADIKHSSEEQKNTNRLAYALFDDIKIISENEIQLEKTVTPGDLEVIKDHVVGDNVIMPGVCFWEMAQIASLFGYGKVPVALKRITYPSALIIDKKGNSRYRLILDKEKGKFTVSAYNEKSEQQWEHVTLGTIEEVNPVDKSLIDIPNIKKRLNYRYFSGRDLNEKFKEKGLLYGEKFYSVTNVWGGKNEALTQLRFKADMLTENYMYHPGILDGALQGIALVQEVAEDTRTFIPYRVEQIDFYGMLPEDCFGHVSLVKYNTDKGIIEFNVSITDIYGNVKISVKKMCLKAVNMQSDEGIRTSEKQIKAYYTPYWTEIEKEKVKTLTLNTILVFEDIKGKDSPLVKLFENRGCKVIKVNKEFSYKKINEEQYNINPYNKEDYQNLFSSLHKDGIEAQGIIYAFDLNNSQEVVDNHGFAVDDIAKGKVLGLIDLINSMRVYNLDETHIAVITGNAFIVNSHDKGYNYPQAAVAGLIRTIPHEYGNIKGVLIDIEENSLKNDSTLKLIADYLMNEYKKEIVSIRNGRLLAQTFKKENFSISQDMKLPLQDQGVYVIAGGLGGIGLEIAKAIAAKVKSKLILIGRSTLPERSKWQSLEGEDNKAVLKKIKSIQDIEAMGSEVITLAVDVCNEKHLTSALESIRTKFNHINGVINAAGILEDALINRVTKEAYETVTKSKILGSCLLDYATNKDNLDFFVIFSAMITYFGNAGQAAYSCANAFEDSFAAYRNFVKGKKTIVINWGVWEEVGLVADSVSKKSLEERGIIPLSTSEAVEAFYSCLTEKHFQFGIGKLNKELEDKLISNLNTTIPSRSNSNDLSKHYTMDIEKLLKEYLLKKINGFRENSSKPMNYKTSFLDAGLDSITIVNFTESFENETGIKLYPTVLFEYPTIQELSKYLLKNNNSMLDKVLNTILISGDEKTGYADIEKTETEVVPEKEQKLILSTDIAVIGMSGSFPGASDINEYWQNLMNGINCVKEVPAERWDWREYYHPDKQKGKTYCKWGGFIDDIDLFDPLFFNLSPKEATVLDPQQRFLLKAAWETLEDAGYADGKLFGTCTGVFVGVSNHNYFDEAFDADNNYSGLATANAIAANRLSYFLDLKGPSMSIDTQCSSSLVALHEACKSLIVGESDYAIAGGVNFLIPKDYYILLSQMEAVSKDGSCKTFDKKANGFISGEGVGVLLLKRLSDAVTDRDNIHCVIKATEVNHDGKSGSLTAPNSKSQFELIKRCIGKAKVNPETITYIETHGTGTSLGDPIEIKGLTEAFTQYTDKKSYCALGAVKSNIGHLESAAGMASIIKVIMAMKNKAIPGNLHFEEKNAFIDFANSPFYVLDKTIKWQTYGNPMRAGISSFGMGGTNGHVILEQAPEYKKYDSSDENNASYPVVLSAKSYSALKKSIIKLTEYLEDKPDLQIKDISYTLNTGRYNFNHRVAIVATSVTELIYSLQQISSNNFEYWQSHKIFYGSINGNDAISHLTASEDEIVKAVVVMPTYDRGVFDNIVTFINKNFQKNKVVMEVFDEYEKAINTMGMSIKKCFQPEVFCQDNEARVCTFAFTVGMIKFLKALGIKTVQVITPDNAKNIMAAAENRKNPEECILEILENTEEGTLNDLEAMDSNYIINLGKRDYLDSLGIPTGQAGVFNIQEGEAFDTDSVNTMISKIYVKGGKINFNAIYSDSERKISLPTYSFQTKSYWNRKKARDVSREDSIVTTEETHYVQREQDYFYKWFWQEVKQNTPLTFKNSFVWVVFCDKQGLYTKIKESLETKNQKVVSVFADYKYNKKDSCNYSINSYIEEDYKALFKEVSADFGRVDTVINLWSYTNTEFQEAMDAGVYGLLGIALGLNANIKGNTEVNLVSITNHSLEVEDVDKSKINVSGYPVHLLSRLISTEIKNITARSIDLNGLEASKEVIEDVIFNYSLTKNGFSELAYRNGKAYIRILGKNALQKPKILHSVWKDGGVYVITGGATGIGAEIGLHIAKKVKATVILIGRTKLPEKSEFKAYLEQGDQKSVVEKIQNIIKIEEAGAQVEYYNGDISDELKTIEILDNISKKFGHITGILHCAGAKRDAIITAKSFKDFQYAIAGKVTGISNIKKAIAGKSVDFVAAFSSIAALYGTPGQSDYSSANALMDAFINDWSGNTETFVTSINWTLWDGAGMDIPLLAKRKMENDGLLPLEISDGISAFEMLLQDRKAPNYIVMKLSESDKFIKDLYESKIRNSMSDKNVLFLSDIQGSYNKPVHKTNNSFEKETKEFLLKMLSELLYLEVSEIDTSRGLDEYGMDSLAIKEALEALEKQYNTVLEPSLFEENPTIDSLTVYLANRLSKNMQYQTEEAFNNNSGEKSNTEVFMNSEIVEDIATDSDEDKIEHLLCKLYEGTINTKDAKEKLERLLSGSMD